MLDFKIHIFIKVKRIFTFYTGIAQTKCDKMQAKSIISQVKLFNFSAQAQISD